MYLYVCSKERKRKQRKPTAGAENKNNGAIRKARTTSAATIRQLTSRINVLESLLGRLVDKLDPNVKSELSEELQSSSFTNGNNDSRENTTDLQAIPVITETMRRMIFKKPTRVMTVMIKIIAMAV